MEPQNYVLIAGDLFPSGDVRELFEKGDVSSIYGERICSLFRNSAYSVANFEGTLTDCNVKGEKVGARIKASPSFMPGIKNLGLNAVALANNHILDFGPQGYSDTVKSFESAGIQHFGTGPSESEIRKSLTVNIEGHRVSFYNVSECFFNVPSAKSPGANIYEDYTVCRDIAELKKCSDYVIVIYHGGSEFFPYPTNLLKKHFHRMVDNGADFITAQHTHCIGCEEYYKGSYLLYGQGNFLFSRQRVENPMLKEGLLVQIVFGADKVEVVKHRTVIDGDIVRYAEDQSLDSFYERSKKVTDSQFLDSEYEKMKVRDFLPGVILQHKGFLPFSKFLRKFMPGFFRKILMKSYSKEQILRNYKAAESEYYQQERKAIWGYMLKKIK